MGPVFRCLEHDEIGFFLFFFYVFFIFFCLKKKNFEKCVVFTS